MSKKPVDWQFEEALKRLEELVRRLEQGNVPLEQSLTEYAEAVELLKICQGKLESAQSRIEILSGLNADGEPILRPLSSAEDQTLEEKRDARSARRSASGGNSPPRATNRRSDVDETGQLF